MNRPNPDEPFLPLSDAEWHSLESRWYHEKMFRYVDWLLAFVDRHRTEIVGLARGSDEPAVLLEATKWLIGERGSLNIRGELKDQVEEMERELWYQGEKGEFDRERICANWTQEHAVAWRRYRILEYKYVADRCAAEVVAGLRSGPGPDVAG